MKPRRSRLSHTGSGIVLTAVSSWHAAQVRSYCWSDHLVACWGLGGCCWICVWHLMCTPSPVVSPGDTTINRQYWLDKHYCMDKNYSFEYTHKQNKCTCACTAILIWAHTWGMKFNATKCYLMSITTYTTPLHYRYTLDNHIHKQVTNNPYLGVLISDNGKWNNHIDKTRRNLRRCNSNFKGIAYKSLIRSSLEYAAIVWDPRPKKLVIR